MALLAGNPFPQKAAFWEANPGCWLELQLKKESPENLSLIPAGFFCCVEGPKGTDSPAINIREVRLIRHLSSLLQNGSFTCPIHFKKIYNLTKTDHDYIDGVVRMLSCPHLMLVEHCNRLAYPGGPNVYFLSATLLDSMAAAMNELTKRQRMFILLLREPLGARDLSQAVGLPEKEIYQHLEHITKTARRYGLRLETALEPTCLACGHVFKRRRHLTPPGRCPICHATHITEPTYQLIPF